MLTYLDGAKDVFFLLQEHCRNGHLVQDADDRTKWYRCCFLRETGRYDKNRWKCSYDQCPVLHQETGY